MKRVRKPDHESVIKLTQRYATEESRLRKIVFQPIPATLTEHKRVVRRECAATIKRLATANKEFAKELRTAYNEGRERAEAAIMARKMNPEPVPDWSGEDARERVNSVRNNAFVELNRGMETAVTGLRHKVSETIRKLDSGEHNLNAYAEAIKETFQKENVFEVSYQNGAKVNLDAYARMLARSSRTETANLGNFDRAQELGSDLVECAEVSPTCEVCARYQGRVYSVSGKDERFPSLYGTALSHGYSLIHPNCRHEFRPFFEELHDEQEIKEIMQQSNRAFADARGQSERTAYAQWQNYNRQMLREEKEYEAMKSTLGDDMPYKTLGGFRRSKRADSEQYHETKLLAYFKEKEYNGSNAYELYKGYREAVKKGDISPLTGERLYRKTAESIQSTLVGQMTADGIEIAGFKTHYIDRTIGGKNRNGVTVEDALDAIQNPIGGIVDKQEKHGGVMMTSRTYIGANCMATINPDTGMLIQANPPRGVKRGKS